MIRDTLSDSLLVERCQRGETNALDELFAKYGRRAFLYSLRMTKHTDDASDVVSEGFIRIHRAIGRFQSNASFSTWMFKILKNCFLDLRKKRRVNVVMSLDEPYESESGHNTFQPIDESESAHDLASKREHSAMVMLAIEELPFHQRDLLQMYYEECLTYEDISVRLDIPAGTIKSRLYRAKLNLKSIIQGSRRFDSLVAV